MFIEFYLLSLAGFLMYLLLSFYVLQRGTPGLSIKDTVMLYLKKNAFFVMLSFVFITVIDYLLTQEGGEFIISLATEKMLTGETPFHFKLFAVLLGLGFSMVFDRLRAIIKPIKLDLEPGGSPPSSV